MKNRKGLKRLRKLSLSCSIMLYIVLILSLPSIGSLLLSSGSIQLKQLVLLQRLEAVAETQTNGTTNNNDFLTYENATYGMSIQYPSTWYKSDNLSNAEQRNINIVEFDTPDPSSSASVIVSQDIINQTEDANVYLAEKIQDYRGNTPGNFTVIKTNVNESMLAGLPGYELLFTTTDNYTGDVILNDEIGAIFPDNIVRYITYGSDITHYTIYRPIVDQMIDSLKIDLPSNETQSLNSNSSSLGQLLQEGLTGEI